jgi:hypothetical protein
MKNELPNGYCLRLRKSCQLGAKRKVISTHKSQEEAEVKAKSLGYDLRVFEILDIYNNRTLTARV